ncbi:MAG: hypothetical protein AAFQ82_05690 [Myxococcota bacterium]
MRARFPIRALLLLTLAIGCSKTESTEEPVRERVIVPVVGLELTVPVGWSLDPSAKLESADAGGLALRLISTHAVSGSPRIDVNLDPAQDKPAQLGELLRRSLEDMNEYERSGDIKIQHVDRREVRIGPRRAFRVAHDYTLEGPSGQIAISQLATLLVLDGRGIVVTAAGRTELFHPQSAEIDLVLSSLSVVMPPAGVAPVKKGDGVSAEQVVEKAQQLVEPMVLDDE